MSEQSIGLQHGATPAVVLPAEAHQVIEAVGAARQHADARAAGAAVARWPRSLAAWATYADLAGDPVARYAAYRVGYHRGLDALRSNGWRGAGAVPWAAPTNRGFLRCVRGLRQMAAEIGEADEVERLDTFLAMLDPAMPEQHD